MPLPVKRYVEPSDSSPSSSDDEGSSPISQDTSQLTDDSQLEVPLNSLCCDFSFVYLLPDPFVFLPP